MPNYGLKIREIIMSCNGWSSHQTWCVNNVFNPTSLADVRYAKETLERLVDAIESPLSDFVNIDDIDWAELESHFEEESEEESEGESEE